MLNIISAETTTKRINNESLRVLTIPTGTYDTFKIDFKSVQHFQAIEDFDCNMALDGVLLKATSRSDALLGIIYTIKKYEAFAKQVLKKDPESFLDDMNFDNYSEAKDDIDDPDDDCYTGSLTELHSMIYDENGNIKNIPLITAEEFNLTHLNLRDRVEGAGQFSLAHAMGGKYIPPSWVDGNFPLVILSLEHLRTFGATPDIDALKAAAGNRFIIAVTIEDAKPLLNRESLTRLTGHLEDRITFETEFGFLNIDPPTEDYHNQILSESAIAKGYSLQEAVDKSKVITDLKSYRDMLFDSAIDISQLINKAIKQKQDSTTLLSTEDFDRIITKHSRTKGDVLEIKTTNEQELDQLIGLTNVKETLYRIVDSLKFEQQRRIAGLVTQYTNRGLVFMGPPGTAKTNTARIFAKMLVEKGILTSSVFRETGRMGLIGKYVGHTGPQVSRVFQEARGGVVFVDEAYSLISDGKEGFSEECMAAIILEMENNPTTLVIFAGYTQNMREFITLANPGLRSRLSHVVEFKDYTPPEMYQIFEYLLTKEQYTLEHKELAEFSICNFVIQMNRLGEGLGNGRLMRKLLRSSLGFMAQRKNNDLKTIIHSDITNAFEELMTSEKLVSSEKRLSLGF